MFQQFHAHDDAAEGLLRGGGTLRSFPEDLACTYTNKKPTMHSPEDNLVCNSYRHSVW
jgi:hypothetical protein